MGASEGRNVAGTITGWVSAMCYLLSRMPQIWRNCKRRSTEGLAISMFFCAVMGNLTYAVSVFLRSVEWDFLYDSLPWLIGSIGTLCFDFTIFVQYHLWKHNDPLPLDDETAP